MKLAPPNRQAVQSLGRHSVGNTGLEGEVALTKAITTVGEDLAYQATEVIDKRQQQKASLHMQKADQAFWEKWGGRDFFNVNELPGDVVTEGMQLEGRIASAEVLPMMYEDHIKTSMGDASKIIELNGSRTRWQTDSGITASNRLSRVQVSAAKSIDAQILKDQTINFKQAIKDRRPEVAYQIAKDLNAPDEVREEYMQVAKQESEIVTYTDMITEGRVVKMKEASDYLGQPHEDYHANNGDLSPAKRLEWKSKLDGELDRLAREAVSKDKTYEAGLRHRIAQQKELSEKGYAIDMGTLSDLSEEIARVNINGKYEAARLDLVDAALYGDNVNRMNKRNPTDRLQFINSVRNSEAIPQLTKDLLVKDLMAANTMLTADLNSDFMGAAEKAGAFGPRGLSPIDVTGNPTMLANQLAVRAQQYAGAQQNYGAELGGGMLPVEEAKQIATQIKQMTTRQQLSVISSVHQSEVNPVEFFQQVGKDGNAGTFAIAGIAMGGGSIHAAETMLDGRKWRMTNGKDLSTVNSLLDAEIFKELGNAYINQPEKYRAVVEATKDAYYGGRQSAMDFSATSIDDDDLALAIRQSTGGLWTHAGKNLPVPEYGMALDVMPRWIQDTDWENFKGKSPAGYPAETFWNDVQEELLTLEPYREPGTYTVSRGGMPLGSGERDQYGRKVPYLLRYDGTMSKSPGWWNRTKDAVDNALGTGE